MLEKTKDRAVDSSRELAMNIQESSTEAPLRILRLRQVCEVTGFGKSMIYQMEAETRFPKRIKIGTRAVGWIEGEVRAWLSRRIQESRLPSGTVT